MDIRHALDVWTQLTKINAIRELYQACSTAVQ